ncbi:MAG: hypothetical protein NC102_03030 [Clostridium sp.]|nr:hypothetical protein [Clostridium sp.]
MIWKLIRKNISAGQICGYALANLIGLAIVITALKFYADASGLLHGASSEKDKGSESYMVISKPVSMFDTFGFGGAGSGISEEEEADLKAQPWVDGVGEFTSANFGIVGAVEMQGRGLRSYIFLESVPDEYLDVHPKEWGFDASKGQGAEIPVIVSKDYLSLYNYGFAPSRGMPQLSESLVSNIPITLYLTGNGHADAYRARIVGFSSRLNTLAVPQEFMDWANLRYSNTPQTRPSRLIVRLKTPGDPEAAKYLEKNGYEAAGERLDQGKAAFALKLVTGVVVGIGGIISALALFILLLSVSLLLQKNRDKNAGLILLGYSPMQVSAVYFRLVALVNACVLALSILIMLCASHVWTGMLQGVGFKATSVWMPIAVGTGIVIAITVINFAAIYRSVRRSF